MKEKIPDQIYRWVHHEAISHAYRGEWKEAERCIERALSSVTAWLPPSYEHRLRALQEAMRLHSIELVLRRYIELARTQVVRQDLSRRVRLERVELPEARAWRASVAIGPEKVSGIGETKEAALRRLVVLLAHRLEGIDQHALMLAY